MSDTTDFPNIGGIGGIVVEGKHYVSYEDYLALKCTRAEPLPEDRQAALEAVNRLICSMHRYEHEAETGYVTDATEDERLDAMHALSDEIVKTIRQCLQSPVESEWRDIKTAPKDGTWIRVATTDYSFNLDGWPCDGGNEFAPELLVKWERRHVTSKVFVWQLVTSEQDGEYNEYAFVTNATHWKPLSTPPIKAKED